MFQTFLTADTHFGHAGIMAMSGRPFSSVEEHDELLIQSWNAVVRPKDEVWHLGDFAMGSSPERCAQIFRRLRGRKILVRGNHDRARTLALGWHERYDLATPKLGGRRWVLCHYPMRAWPGAWRGARHAFGHTHGLLADTSRSCDVGVDRWSYRPASVEEVLARQDATPGLPEELAVGGGADGE